jgi:undecaprenyl diphosphate synthase
MTKISTNNELKHIAIIMDGNARWAKAHNLTKAQGHRRGALAAQSLLPFLPELGVEYVTLYAFSSENWHRPKLEVQVLLKLLSDYLINQLGTLQQYGIRLKIIGDLSKLPEAMQHKIDKVMEQTKDNVNVTLCVAFSYGGREEIINACKKLINSGASLTDEESLRPFLYDSEMPDVDLMIRTSGAQRISNFLLWQSAYAEFYFLPKLWPDVTIEDIKTAIDDYHQRFRSFGVRQ